MKHSKIAQAFETFSARANTLCGSPTVFVGAVSTILLWFVSGPFFHWSDTWQLIANTGTTLVTFLLGFIISNAQNRSAARDHAQMHTLARLEREHGEELRLLREMLAEVHTHTHCDGHTTIESTPVKKPARKPRTKKQPAQETAA